jgi:hypothetical protein
MLAVSALIGAFALVSASPASAEEVRLGTPSNASQARGTTFEAIVTRFYTTQVQGHTLHFLVFHVLHVYAGASHGIRGQDPRPGDGSANEIVEPGVDLAVYQQADGVNSLDSGTTYFFSTADIDTPVVGNSVAWSVDGNRLTWVAMSPVPGGGDPRFKRVHTLAEAIALMAPNLPASDEPVPNHGSDTTLVLVLAALLGTVLSMRLLRVRIRKPPTRREP